MRKLVSLIDRFRRDQRGNIAVIFVIACVPLISAVGCAVDYTRATQMQSKLQAAIDFALASAASIKPADESDALLSGCSARIFPALSKALRASSKAAAGNKASASSCSATR